MNMHNFYDSNELESNELESNESSEDINYKKDLKDARRLSKIRKLIEEKLSENWLKKELSDIDDDVRNYKGP